MSMFRISLRKAASMLGGVSGMLILLLVIVVAAYTVSGVFSSRRAETINIDVINNDGGYAVEQIFSKMQQGGSIEIRFVTENEAKRDLLFGKTEGVLTVGESFERSVVDGDPAFSYQSAPQSASSAFVLARFSEALISFRIRQNCIQERIMSGVSAETAESEVDAAWNVIASRHAAGYSVTETATGSDVGTSSGVFLQTYAKANGFCAMLLMFLYVSALQWLIQSDVRQVGSRLDSQRFGRFIGNGTDMIAMLLIGITVVVLCGIVMHVFSFRYLLLFFAYCVFLSGFFLLLSRVLRANGQVQTFVPFVTLISSLLGGCLFDLSALSNIWKKAALFTPQGLLLCAFESGSVLPALLLLILGFIAFLFSLAPSRHVV